MKLFYTSQISKIDKYTIDNEPIASIDLMERAANVIYKKLSELFSKKSNFVIVAGSGNNGGDSLAVARLLFNNGYSVRVFLLNITGKYSEDCKTNIERLKHANINFKTSNVILDNGLKMQIPNQVRNDENIKFSIIKNAKNISFKNDEVIIDAIFGSGLTRNADGFVAEIINKINNSGCKVISIDMPSGLFGEDNSENNLQNIVKANYTLTLQFPKISFFFAENSCFVGEWIVLPIGLHKDIVKNEPSKYFYVKKEFANNILHKRNKFSHKGNYGHALLISGSKGKMGAAILASRACLRSGVGLLTTHVPSCGNKIMQTAVPEAMLSLDENDNVVTNITNFKNYNAIGIGPGVGTNKTTLNILKQLFKNNKLPIVIDADGLNLISQNPDLLKTLPENSILTPHPKEFDRLAGNSKNTYSRHLNAIKFANEHKVYIVLKGAYTQIICPNGDCYFNSTGNPGMATAGSGDVLTGILLSFLAQGYNNLESVILGVYIHGLSGDIAVSEKSQESLIASDIIENLGKAFKKLTVCL